MDTLFKNLLEVHNKFKMEWLKTPYLYWEKLDFSHKISYYNYKMQKNSKKA